MQITFVTEVGDSYPLEIDPNMELENIMALLEAEVGASHQQELCTLTKTDAVCSVE